MKVNKNIQSEIDKTLKSLDNWKKIETDPFFYTRLSARMINNERSGILSSLMNWPILKPALIAVTLTINIITIGYMYSSKQNMLETEFADAFTSEYFLDQSTESYLVTNE